MQNPNLNPSHCPSSVPPEPGIDPAVLARAYERAVRRMRSGEPGLGDLFAALTARGDEPPGEQTQPRGPAARHTPVAQPDEGAPGDDAPDDGDDPESGLRVTLDELLPVFRAPIEWALARAEHHAQGDPVDLAALGRIRAAYEGRLAWALSGGTFGVARPQVRPTDVLTVAGLVVGSIDPGFAERTSAHLRESFRDALAGVIQTGPTHALGTTSTPQPAAPLWYGAFPAAPLPFGAPHLPYLAMPGCCCRHGHL